MLKFIEILHYLDYSKTLMKINLNKAKKKKKDLYLQKINLARSLGFTVEYANKSQSYLLEKLINSARVCANTIELFRSGVLILDEVDLILHPLKSELNWPCGEKTPLDFTIGTKDIIDANQTVNETATGGTSVLVNKESDGLRWEIPYHLLDAIFYAQTTKISVSYHDSKDAINILNEIKVAIEQGCQLKLLQKTPHLVLLSTDYYHLSLKPLIAKWMVLWLETNGVTKLTTQEILLYILKRNDTNNSEIIKVKELVNTKLAQQYVKMLNLTYDWLQSFTPHVFSKIDRVSFGLLREYELNVMLKEDPKMPFSRRVLAIPFIGKDVPSRSSEFSHPDVIIGLTILAYRYEGLRNNDLKQIIRNLRDNMEDQNGPFNKRTLACKLFASWIHHAGGKVRGWKKYKREYEINKVY